MILASVHAEWKVVALEWAAVRDPERKMKLRWVLRSFVLFIFGLCSDVVKNFVAFFC